MIKFVSALALIASMAKIAQANPAKVDIEAYITTQETLNRWERAQNCEFTDTTPVTHTGTEADDTSYGDSSTAVITHMAFVHIPKSG